MVHVNGIDDRMIANNLEPYYLTHPGEVIKDELEARGISQRQLAKSIGVPVSQLNELLNAKRSLSAEMAILVGHALGLDPAPLLALQTDYNLLSAKRSKSLLERLKDIPRIAAVFWADTWYTTALDLRVRDFERNASDSDVLAVRNTCRRVLHEQLRMKQFIRFQKAKDGTYLAVVSPDHNVLPLITDHFQDLWRTYFKAICIKERMNPKKRLSDMSRRYWKYMTEKNG